MPYKNGGHFISAQKMYEISNIQQVGVVAG